MKRVVLTTPMHRVSDPGHLRLYTPEEAGEEIRVDEVRIKNLDFISYPTTLTLKVKDPDGEETEVYEGTILIGAGSEEVRMNQSHD